ncbi:gamma-mobile-trio recombinase GmtY [Halopseudomonas yangmingensis]|uniref:Site-specific recombinase XerD n=1 Tax=Halopseudomonas yangmingensis TaxID=1720063 RepID=A0A1I4SZL8_9GAMM|nr:gamma-mobile-trio recombinase GmtY [Halopseudomonas yangmingensis]SFM69763.1 Site-specific recombinase XerD [Halopseudomonas yangmingensis]
MKSTFKLIVDYTDIASGKKQTLPAVYTSKGILISHLRYLAWNSDKSQSWKQRSVFSVRLLIDYVEAAFGFKKTTALLKSFTEALVTGTIDYESSTDPLGLYWKPRDLVDANNILSNITNYTDFIARQEGHDDSLINPFREATGWEERMNWCAYYNKQANVFLNHLSSYSEAKKMAGRKRLIYTPMQMMVSNEKAERFPEDKIENLLMKGFYARNKHDYRSQLITMLMNYGGLRKSEVFHLYISDITVHPVHADEALVRVYHPEYGRSPDLKYKNRSEYLISETDYKSRNKYQITERLYSGWKNPMLASKDGYFEVVFNPASKARDFINLWVKYLKFQRVEPVRFHPFAFTNDKGEPETLKNFQQRHKRAVERIGLICKKEFGTTEHGHRHAYGYRGRKMGFSQVELQKMMHHKSPNSCLIYIKPTNEDVRDQMRNLNNEKG